MILSEIKRYFDDHALLQDTRCYVGIAPPKDENGDPLDIPYVVMVPMDLTTEYTMPVVTSTNTAQPCVDTLNFEFHIFSRSSDDLEQLIESVTNAFDNQRVVTGNMECTRLSIRYAFDSTYTCGAIITYRIVRTSSQNTK